MEKQKLKRQIHTHKLHTETNPTEMNFGNLFTNTKTNSNPKNNVIKERQKRHLSTQIIEKTHVEFWT